MQTKAGPRLHPRSLSHLHIHLEFFFLSLANLNFALGQGSPNCVILLGVSADTIVVVDLLSWIYFPCSHIEVYSWATASLAGCLQAVSENVQGGVHLGRGEQESKGTKLE